MLRSSLPAWFRGSLNPGRKPFVPAAFRFRRAGAGIPQVLLGRGDRRGCFIIVCPSGHHAAAARPTPFVVGRPWGEVLLDMGQATGVAFVDIDLRVASAAADPGAGASPADRCRGSRPVIVFDLHCADSDDRFEAWFRSNADFDWQLEQGLVRCPVCQSRAVSKAPMAPRVPGRSNRLPNGGNALANLASLQAELLQGSRWVGERFAETARAMHLGETEPTLVHGEGDGRGSAIAGRGRRSDRAVAAADCRPAKSIDKDRPRYSPRNGSVVSR